jgi:glycosyltransferase involved in cell wall biosynthesis
MNTGAAMTVSVVIPLYNEEENVAILNEKLTETLSTMGCDYEIIYVDDGSTDRTMQLLEEIHKSDSHVVVLCLRRNFGQTAALRPASISRAAMWSSPWTEICRMIQRTTPC